MNLLNYLKKKDRGINILKLICAFSLFYYSSYSSYILVWLFKLSPKNSVHSVILNTFSNLLLLIVLVFMYREELKREWLIFKDKVWDNLDVGLKAWIVGTIGMMVTNMILMYFFKSGQSNNEQAVQSMIKSLPWLMLIDAGIIGPIIEEILFRKAFKNVLSNKYVYIIVSGLVFGLMHVITSCDNFIDFLFFIPYTCLGIAFSYSYYKTKTIYTSMTLHAFHNCFLVLLSMIK